MREALFLTTNLLVRIRARSTLFVSFILVLSFGVWADEVTPTSAKQNSYAFSSSISGISTATFIAVLLKKKGSNAEPAFILPLALSLGVSTYQLMAVLFEEMDARVLAAKLLYFGDHLLWNVMKVAGMKNFFGRFSTASYPIALSSLAMLLDLSYAINSSNEEVAAVLGEDTP